MPRSNIKKSPKTTRISITVNDEELKLWESYNYKGNLSQFIRDGVNEYIKIQEPNSRQTLFDLYLNQHETLKNIQTKLIGLERIEGELIDLASAMAKFDMVDLKERDGQWIWETKTKNKKD